jgi:tetratricopeptide (TPR) repeat protein
MFCSAAMNFLCFVLLQILVLTGQVHAEGERGESSSGVDYFADHDFGTKQYVQLVESAHMNKITEWIRNGRIENALADCKYTLERIPNHPKGLMLAQIVGRLTKNPMLAISYYQRAMKLYPQYALTRAQYGAYLVDEGNLKAGIAELQKAVEMDSKLAFAHAQLAKAYLKAGNTELARQAAGQAKELGYKGKDFGQALR